MQGRRRPDTVFGQMPEDFQPGDYWKILDQDGQPRRSDHPENLTGTCWHVIPPTRPSGGESWALGRLEFHTVREHDDGTISVRPGDGSSNSILITGPHDYRWHGFVDHGVWEEA